MTAPLNAERVRALAADLPGMDAAELRRLTRLLLRELLRRLDEEPRPGAAAPETARREP